MTPTFEEHTRQAQEHPAYWSCLMTLELIDALVASRASAPGACYSGSRA